MSVDRDEIERLTRELATIPSHADATPAGDRIERWLRAETDAAVTRDSVGNVLARRGGAPRALALVGHHDVVPPADEQLDGDDYRLTERDGRLYGRGTADMKGALAAMCCAFRDATLDGDRVGVTLASFVGEETGGRGARHAIERGFGPDRAIICEGSTGYSAPGVTDVAIAPKGRRASTFTATGTAAHASEPDAGVNAIDRACEGIAALRELEPPAATVLGHELTGSVAVTGIEGGSAWNVIPERCTVTVDERTVPDARLPLADVAAGDGLEWTVDQDLPPMACDDAAFANTVRAAARDAQAGEAAHVVKPHATDAGWLARAGTSCLVCGPAEPGEAHTADESVSLTVLARCAAIYRDAIERALA